MVYNTELKAEFIIYIRLSILIIFEHCALNETLILRQKLSILK